MKLLVSAVFFCLIFYPPTAKGVWSSTPRLPPPPGQRPPPVYNHIQFVQSWKPTYCKKITCDKSRKNNFYTHGIWPADSSGMSLHYCRGQFEGMTVDEFKKEFEDKADDAQMQDLVNYWPSLKGDSYNKIFWTDEWHVHGVCSSNTFTPKEYFMKGVALRRNLELLDILINAQIRPDPYIKYSRDAIKTAIQNALGRGINIRITCLNFRNEAFLFEVYICMDPLAINYVRCPHKTDSCGSVQPNILIPKS